MFSTVLLSLYSQLGQRDKPRQIISLCALGCIQAGLTNTRGGGAAELNQSTSEKGF